MDCNTARLLLAFARPKANDLDAVETAELERHLAACPACAPAAAAHRRFEESISRAMLDVDIPDRLNPRIHEQLRADLRERNQRRQFWRFSAAAVVLFTVSAGVLTWSLWPKIRLDQEQIAGMTQEPRPTPAEIEKFFRGVGHEVVLPSDLVYGYCKGQGLVEFQGQLAPGLFFASEGNYAVVHILSARKYDFQNDQAFHSPPAEGYPKLTIEFSHDRRFAYVIEYTGKDLSWLQPNRAVVL